MKMGSHCFLLLGQLALFHITFGSEVVVQINTKKWIYYVPERFLSLTVDPLTLAAASPLTQESLNMAKGLSPSFVRLGGIGTNAVYFGKKFMENSTTVSEEQWDSVNEFAKKAGLDVIASLNPTSRSEGSWDPQNSLELITYSSKKHYGVAWQLGYDTRGWNASGADVGKDLVKLRKMLDGVANYANSPVFGPDMTSVNGAKQIHFIKDLITNAGNPLACLILRPNFKNDAQPEDPYDLISSMTNELDTYVWNKDVRVGKSVPKKPVWIAEPMASQGSFEETMKFAKRVGHAARLGVQIYLRQAGAATLKSPTPDYWFSLLYKTLVGQGVLDYKIVSRNQTGLHMFTHCTATIPQDKSVLDSDWNYEKGAVTIYGVNESPEPTKLVLKVTSKEEPIHIYTLTSSKMNTISADSNVVTLLNGQELKLSPSGELPVLSPKVKKPSRYSSVTIPGGSIYFVVMPDSRVRTCSVVPISAPDLSLSDLTKRLRLGPQKKLEESKEDREDEELQSEEGVYVSFTKKRSAKDSESPAKPDILGKTLMRTIMTKLAPRKIDVKTEEEQEETPVKYITFNENSFLNKLADGIKEEIRGESAESNGNTNSKKDRKFSVKYKYPALVSAIEKTDKTSEPSVLKSPRTDDSSSVTNDDGKIQIVSIKPLDPGVIDEGTSLSRSRRSSREEPPLEGSVDLKATKMIEDLVEAKKKGTPLSDEVSDVDKNLSQRDVTWKLPDDADEETRKARHVPLEPAHEVFRTTKHESEDDTKARNVRHVGDAKEEQELGQRTDDVKSGESEEKNIETETLAKIVEKTEQISSVSESPLGVIVPDDVSQEKLDDLMLKKAKSDSEPEPDPSKDNPTDLPPSDNSAQIQTQQSAEKTQQSVPLLLIPAQPENTPFSGQPGENKSPLPGQFNPMVVPSPSMPGTTMTELGERPMIASPPQNSDLLSPNNLGNPALIPPVSSVIPEVPDYNEKKENAINKILKKIVTEEDSALAKMPTDGLKQGMVEEVTPSQIVPVDVDGHTVLIAPDDLIALKQPDGKDDKSESIHVETDAHQTDNPTLVDSGKNLDLESEVGNQSPPSVKVARQVKLRLPISPSPTPKAATATLAAPVAEPASTTPVSTIPTLPAPKETKVSSTNQIPPIKPPSPEELRERYKVLREKMLELRQQYLEARDKRLEEFRKQVAVARTVPDAEGTIKSTIKRREAELKEWFKKFDKRETDPDQPILSPELSKPRPRRLSMFTNDENFDMEKFFEGDPVESYNYKRSPEVATPQQQSIPTGPELKTSDRANIVGKLIPLETKTPQGIVYNNRIYPARLFGYVDPQNSYGATKQLVDIEGRKAVGNCNEYEVRETAEISPAFTRERLAYVPKDAFIKEFKSDFVPVVVLDPEENVRGRGRSKRSPYDQSKPLHLIRPRRAILTRKKRSTLTDLEEKLVRVKDEMFPKISSWLKNLSEHPPWKRDLQQSTRGRRSIKDFLLTNDLRNLKYLPQVLPKPRNALRSGPEIEDFVFRNIDRGENKIVKLAEEFDGLTEKIGKSAPSKDDGTEGGYCEEIATSGKSVIRDPFAAESIESKSSVGLKAEKGNHTKKHELPKPLRAEERAHQSNAESESETLDEVMFASIVAEKIRDFFTNVQQFFGASDRT